MQIVEYISKSRGSLNPKKIKTRLGCGTSLKKSMEILDNEGRIFKFV
jgi:hypothetical protein